MNQSADEQSPVTLFERDDPAIIRANQEARKSFRYFYRELAWERKRIIPGLELACVKAPFFDSGLLNESGPNDDDNPEAEHMWIDEVEFDGVNVSGVLLNSPNWIKSVKAGDEVSVPLTQISDWMYSVNEKIYGGFTINAMRARMSRGERKQHDAAWGLNFGDPEVVHLIPCDWFEPKPGFFARLLGKEKVASAESLQKEHPMSDNMGSSLDEHIKTNPMALLETDERGFAMLHELALAGSEAGVRVLLDHGADRNVLTGHGMKPIQLAQSLEWTRVIKLLEG